MYGDTIVINQVKFRGKQSLINYFGYWPKFCDAKILGIKFKTTSIKTVEVLIELRYLDANNGLGGQFKLHAMGVSEIKIDDIQLQNVIEEIEFFQQATNAILININAISGLTGSILCNSIEFSALETFSFQPLDPENP